MTSVKSLFVIFSLALLISCSNDDARWKSVPPGQMGMNVDLLEQARDYALKGGGSGYILRSGKVVMKWGDESHRYDLKSTTKSIAVSALGLALRDKRVRLSEILVDGVPEFKSRTPEPEQASWLNKITLKQIAEQVAGFDKPGGYCKLTFEPGTAWGYSDCGPNWLADYLTLTYEQDLADLLESRLFDKLGISSDDLRWRDNAYREPKINGLPRREFGSGIHANVRAMAKVGQLYLSLGNWDGEQILDEQFVRLVSRTNPNNNSLEVVASNVETAYENAPRHYGMLWWNNNDGSLPKVPRDAFWSWGYLDSLIFIIPSLDIVAVRAGNTWPGFSPEELYSRISGFLNPIVESVNRGAPYPNSSLISGVSWDEVVYRGANGSDNWPITWGDDDKLYTAYGDGWGFEPKVDEKLSLGLAKIQGMPGNIEPQNIRSATAEQIGDGKTGKKASGILMLDSILYMWVRNANNNGQHCQLAWSSNRGKFWEWSPWLETRMGYCVFLNFGKNYAGARDEYVYTYSPDTDSAYYPSDHVILARVQQQNIKSQSSYEFFAGLDSDGIPMWSHKFANRKPVFTMIGGSNRLDVVYNAGLERYLMTMRNVGDTAWKPGGPNHWGLYESPNPWGPWRTILYTENWDIDPGEALRIPSKWISADGREFFLVFSGDDSFAVRKAKLSLNPVEIPNH